MQTLISRQVPSDYTVTGAIGQSRQVGSNTFNTHANWIPAIGLHTGCTCAIIR